MAALLVPAGHYAAPRPQPRIVRVDPRFDMLVPADATLEKVADGFTWVEGPVWNKKGGYLLFSDIPQNSIFKWQEGKGADLFMKPSGYTGAAPFAGREPGSNGLTYDPQGRLVLAEHGDRRVTRLEGNGNKTTLADRYQGKRINSPNDMVFKSNGDLYFTDPPFGLPRGAQDPGKELPFNGVYRLAKKGRLTLLTRDIPFPNGIAFSPDEKTLYISNADLAKPTWMAFPVKSDGTIGMGRLLYDGTSLRMYGKGTADGLKVDRHGNIFGAGPGGIHVFAPDGTLLGSIITGNATGNCAFGGDGSYLYIASDTAIYRIRTSTRGNDF
jgi:gluconolactonase